MKSSIYLMLTTVCLFMGCTGKYKNQTASMQSGYFDYSKSDDQKTGGIKMIPITTPKGTFNVWTKRVGNNPKMKVLLLLGGPGGTNFFF